MARIGRDLLRHGLSGPGEPGVAPRPEPHFYCARHHAVAETPAGELVRLRRRGTQRGRSSFSLDNIGMPGETCGHSPHRTLCPWRVRLPCAQSRRRPIAALREGRRLEEKRGRRSFSRDSIRTPGRDLRACPGPPRFAPGVFVYHALNRGVARLPLFDEGMTLKKLKLDVLSNGTNAAVVRMPDRRYPGLVVQGDRLIYLNAKAKELSEGVSETGNERLARLARNLHHEISQLLEIYSAACRAEKNAE